MVNKEEVLMELSKLWTADAVRDDELTKAEIMESIIKIGGKVSKSYIERRLIEMCDEGIMGRRSAKRRSGVGGKCFAYSPAEGKTWEDVLQYLKNK